MQSILNKKFLSWLPNHTTSKYPSTISASPSSLLTGKVADEKQQAIFDILKNTQKPPVSKALDPKEQKEINTLLGTIETLCEKIFPEIYKNPPEGLEKVRVRLAVEVYPSKETTEQAGYPHKSPGKKPKGYMLTGQEHLITYTGNTSESSNVSTPNVSMAQEYAAFFKGFQFRLEEELLQLQEKSFYRQKQIAIHFDFSEIPGVEWGLTSATIFPFSPEARGRIEARQTDWMISVLQNHDIDYMDFLYHRPDYYIISPLQ